MDIFEALQGLALNRQPQFGNSRGLPINSPQPTSEGIQSLLNQLNAIDAEETFQNVGGPQIPAKRIPVQNISNFIRQELGDKEAPKPNKTQEILASRFEPEQSQLTGFGPSFADFGAAIAKSAGGKVTSGQEIYDARNQNSMEQMAQFGKFQKDTKESSGLFGGTGMDAQVYNILATKDPSSREYQIAYNIASEPKTQVGADGTISVVKPNLSAFTNPGTAQSNIPNAENYNIGGADVTRLPSETAKFKNQLEGEGKLRDDYLNQSKAFITQRDAFSRIEQSAKNPSPAGDLALIFNYMKVLDPGSTVREGEFATAQNSGSLDSRIAAQYNRVLSGERLAPEMRADFVNRARLLYQGAEQQQQQNAKIFSELATKAKVDPTSVAVDLSIPAQDPYVKAREAILRGADPQAVAQRLQQSGYDPALLGQ